MVYRPCKYDHEVPHSQQEIPSLPWEPSFGSELILTLCECMPYSRRFAGGEYKGGHFLPFSSKSRDAHVVIDGQDLQMSEGS